MNSEKTKSRACLFTACYLKNENDPNGGGTRLDRYKKYLNFYRPLKEEMGFQDFVFIDNASPLEEIEKLGGGDDLIVHRFTEFLDRAKGYAYPYGWRMVHTAREYLDKYDKIIFLDSDGFVLSPKLAHFIRDTNHGWNALWCPKYNFAECNLAWLCKDQHKRFLDFIEGDYTRHLGKCMEKVTPFTKIWKDFVSDRFGESRLPQLPYMDFYAQCPVDLEMIYQKE